MTDSPRPYIVRYHTADKASGFVHVTAYNVMEAVSAACVALAAQNIAIAGFDGVEPDQQQWERLQQERMEAMKTDFTSMLRGILRKNEPRG